MLTLERDVPLAPFSTFRIGGPADFFASVTTTAELIEALEYAADNSLKTFRADIDYARERANLAYGVIGIKVWIYKGQVFEGQEKKR
jgi:hypothetical protein